MVLREVYDCVVASRPDVQGKPRFEPVLPLRREAEVVEVELPCELLVLHSDHGYCSAKASCGGRKCGVRGVPVSVPKLLGDHLECLAVRDRHVQRGE